MAIDASDYDDLMGYASLPPQTSAEVDKLAQLADGGAVLELGVGTGRVAIPLAGRGLEVHGLDLDPTMLELLVDKPGGASVTTHLGDMAEVPVEGPPFALVCAMFGTFFALPDQDAQVACMRRVAEVLAPGGVFVVEALMPRSPSIDHDRSVTPAGSSSDRVVLNVSERDPVAQTLVNHQLVVTESGTRINPIRTRYCWPSELDLMATVAGLERVARWSDWDETPFGPGLPRHISIYRRPGA